MDWNYRRDPEGRVVGFTSIVTDISEIRKSEEREKALLVAAASAKEAEKHSAEIQQTYEKLRTTQTQLVQAGRLAALGELGTGIAHELNQPLTGILHFTRMALKDLEPDNPLAGDLQVIEDRAGFLGRILGRLKIA